jgi:hypothetical protein
LSTTATVLLNPAPSWQTNHHSGEMMVFQGEHKKTELDKRTNRQLGWVFRLPKFVKFVSPVCWFEALFLSMALDV